MRRQYISVSFGPFEVRDWTFHNEGPPVFVGERRTAETSRGESVVTVMEVDIDEPEFRTRQIGRRIKQSEDPGIWPERAKGI